MLSPNALTTTRRLWCVVCALSSDYVFTFTTKEALRGDKGFTEAWNTFLSYLDERCPEHLRPSVSLVPVSPAKAATQRKNSKKGTRSPARR